MIFTNGERCCVCDKEFTENDDIVVCPECGTPHHRECYNQLGHCVNIDSHGSFEYNVGSASSKNKEPESKHSEYYYDPSESAFNSDGQSSYSYSNVQNDYADEEIDGKKLKDISSVVGSNSKHFIKYFRSGKKLSWNWGAFIFSGYYFFFRKMYLNGALVVAAKLAASFLIQGIFSEQMTAYANLIKTIYSIYSGNNTAELTNEIMSQINSAYQSIMPLLIASFAASLVISVICGLIADMLYKKKVFSILDKIEETLENGGSFGVNPMFNTGENMTQEKMRELYLRRLGGVSIFAPLIAYIVLDIVSGFISKL